MAVAIGCGSPNHDNPDSSTPGDGAADAHVANGQFGDACNEHTDCLSGYCVEPAGGAGGQCSRTCNDDCPTGWDCLPVKFPEGDVKLCVPATGRLCNPCAQDSECPGGACLTIDGAKRCGTTCSSNADCTTGYQCALDQTGMHPGNYCQPVTASCTCSAEMVGAMRSCSTMNTIGTCWGTQTCQSGGWTSCTATTPAAETCDGADNDCNFLIDDGVGGGETCTITNGFGSCPGVRTCEGTSGFVCNGPQPMAELCNSIDDNCNGSVDEGFTNLGSLCSAGVGACLRYGSMQCNSGGTGTVCSAVPGTATTEMCNHADDDCDGMVDETFTNLGQQCSAGLGVCTRYGTYVCRADGTNTECSAVPGSPSGADVCNYLDDNCNGTVDEGFKDPLTGLYTSDQNCGACGTDCTSVFAGAPNATGGCVVTTTATCGLRCNAGYFDLNAATPDGCEFQLDTNAIYVSSNDLTSVDDSTCGLGPSGTGTGNHPCKTISYGIVRSQQTGRAKVLVADATYNEGVTIANGKNLYGGYRADTWERHLATTSTIVQGTVPNATNHDMTFYASSITAATVVEGFVIRGSFNTKAGGNSYAVYVTGSSAALVFQNNQIFGGRGGPGAAGPAGSNGLAGVNGAAYSASMYDAFQVSGSLTCPSTANRTAYGGGVRQCAGPDDVGGGNGGGNNCTPQRSTQNSTASYPAVAGQPGAGVGGGTAGQPGARGYDADWNANTCLLPVSGGNVLPMFGTDGTKGGPGAAAGGVAGCTSAAGSVVGGHWVGGSGATGLLGANGGGGGGGGAGGGATCTNCNVGNMKNAILGGHGGGAGTGGCGGTGGGGGGSGGASFAVFVVSGSAPTFNTNTISLGTGGSGGGGGIGGAGGLGGTGSSGGNTGSLFCSGKGGRGGDGGDGGAGSGGGGGCGGNSYGFFTSGVGTPTYCSTNTLSGGSGGTHGNGGYSAGAPGGNGIDGIVRNCTSI